MIPRNRTALRNWSDSLRTNPYIWDEIAELKPLDYGTSLQETILNWVSSNMKYFILVSFFRALINPQQIDAIELNRNLYIPGKAYSQLEAIIILINLEDPELIQLRNSYHSNIPPTFVLNQVNALKFLRNLLAKDWFVSDGLRNKILWELWNKNNNPLSILRNNFPNIIDSDEFKSMYIKYLLPEEFFEILKFESLIESVMRYDWEWKRIHPDPSYLSLKNHN